MDTSFINKRTVISIIVFVFILISIPFTFYLAQKTQIFKPKALETANNTAYDTKVLVIKYFPPDLSGTRIDPAVAGTNETIEAIRSKVNQLNNLAVQSLTNASKYHGYKDSNAPPSLNYSIVDSKEVLASLPRGLQLKCIEGQCTYRPDYKRILNDYNICDYVNNQGVKQVWFWGYHHGLIEPVESNMSMGTNSRRFWNRGNYGDISNSELTDDLPICQKTYVLYNYNFTRGLGEILEDHGHHLESVMKFVDYDLFWLKWVNPFGLTNGQTNHCGWTHSPPNVTDDNQYFWHSETTVKSDCEDWKPDGTGQVKDVNCHTWYGTSCSENSGVEFKIWWMQNLPGLNNNLTYQGKRLRNWWEFYGDLDAALAQGKTAFIENLASPNPSPSQSPQPSPSPSSSPGLNISSLTQACIKGDLDGNRCITPGFTGNDFQTWLRIVTDRPTLQDAGKADVFPPCASDGRVDINDFNLWLVESLAGRNRCT